MYKCVRILSRRMHSWKLVFGTIRNKRLGKEEVIIPYTHTESRRLMRGA